MRWCYTVFYYLAVPFVLLRLWWRGRRLPAYRERWSERFARAPRQPQKKCWWLHAVSVGEFMAAKPLIEAICKQYPDVVVLVTTNTPTASKLVQEQLSGRVLHQYVPFDLPGCWRRFLATYQPRVAITMETELWPNMCHALQHAGIPWMVANARLSTRSCRRYLRIRWAVQPMFKAITKVAAQTSLDAAHFILMGVKANNVEVTGNIKFDIDVPEDCLQKAETIRVSWGQTRPVWIAASTHEGEESIVLEAFLQIKQQTPNALLVLVMRHPERVKNIMQMVKAKEMSGVQRSRSQPVTEQIDVVVGDTLGELFELYAASDVVFVGGSLVPVGGHNLIEPAAVEKPIITGPYLSHCLGVKRALLVDNALLIVDGAEQLAKAVMNLFNDQAEQKAMGVRAKTVTLANKGALAAQMRCLASMLNR